MTIDSLRPEHSTAPRRGEPVTGIRAVRIAAILAALAAVAAWPLAIIAVPQSGAWCRQAVCLSYPFTDARYVPHDFWWMYPATLSVLSFAVVLALLEPHITPERRTAGRLASLAATTGAVVLAATYTMQLMAVQPSIIKGEQDGLSLWSQYNPHGAFIAMESLGYLLLSLALVAVAAIVPGGGVLRRTLRVVSGTLGALGAVALPIQAAVLGSDLNYAYEITALSIVWIALVIVPNLLTRAIVIAPLPR